jgi:hypothetical protein
MPPLEILVCPNAVHQEMMEANRFKLVMLILKLKTYKWVNISV